MLVRICDSDDLSYFRSGTLEATELLLASKVNPTDMDQKLEYAQKQVGVMDADGDNKVSEKEYIISNARQTEGMDDVRFNSLIQNILAAKPYSKCLDTMRW